MKTAATADLSLRLLGPLRVLRGGEPVALPRSRKVRALLAYLALSVRPLGRGALCELLWEDPNDPRGELRWCLSRLRAAIDTPERKRVVTQDDAIALDLSGVQVDALEAALAAQAGIESLELARMRALAALFAGDFLEGLDVDSRGFASWVTAQRRRLRAFHAALLEQLATRLPPEEAQSYLEEWLAQAPFDRRVHERLLGGLARQGRVREGDEHLAATAALFENEGLDAAPLREAWRSALDSRDQGRSHREVAIDDPLGGRTAGSEPPNPLCGRTPGSEVDGTPTGPARRASIAIMPFADDAAAAPRRGGLGDALAHDVTARLAKLRSLFVIAQGSTIALHDRRVGPEEAGRMLDVDYVLGGSLYRPAGRLRVTVELTETRTARVVWSELLNYAASDALVLLDEIGNRIVASVASEIETLERNRAILRPPSSLDAWEAHHRGLWHMYKFTRADNDRARHFFGAAVKLDPTFSRAWAGVSFTHFQSAFQGWAPRGAEVTRAFETASQSLAADDRDPAAHWSMGRALWLRGEANESVGELKRAIDLSPNFAMGHYALAFVQSQAGDPADAIALADCSRELSPFDPLLFAFFGARAMALVRQQKFDEAAEWAVKAATRPNAHVHIQALAAYALALAHRTDAARGFAATVRSQMPGYGLANFFDAFRFDADGSALFREGARRLGMG